MRAVTAATMREMDRRTIEDLGVPGSVLMERAGAGATEVALDLLGASGREVTVLCGKGNNGGDGFVIARRLLAAGHRVSVHTACEPSEIRGDAARALEAYRGAGGVLAESRPEAVRASLASADLAVDALLGTGVTGAVGEPIASWIGAVNAAGRRVLAVDIPSGLSADTGAVLGVAARADVTVTFALPKLGLLQHPGAALAGRIVCVDIGIPADLAGPDCPALLESADVAALLPVRHPYAHKGDAGRVLIVAGSTGLTGAACLAAHACCRAGAGLVTVAIPGNLCASVEARLLEAMTWPLGGCRSALAPSEVPEILERASGASALAVGPGLGRAPETLEAVRGLLDSADRPVIVDADALHALPEWHRAPASGRSLVLTPHPGEMAVMLGCGIGEVQADRIAAALAAARRYGATVVLKGAGTVIACDDGRVAISPTGHAGMASGGMGDVLTGLVAALLGQGMPAFDAACAGAFLHGWAATLAAERLGGPIGLLASDVANALPRARESVVHGRGPASPVERHGEPSV